MTTIKKPSPLPETAAKDKTNVAIANHKEKLSNKKAIIELAHALNDLTKAIYALGGS